MSETLPEASEQPGAEHSACPRLERPRPQHPPVYQHASEKLDFLQERDWQVPSDSNPPQLLGLPSAGE